MKRIVAYAMPVILAFRKRLVNVKGKGGGNMMKKHLKKLRRMGQQLIWIAQISTYGNIQIVTYSHL